MYNPVGRSLKLIAHVLDFWFGGSGIAPQTDISPHLIVGRPAPSYRVVAHGAATLCSDCKCVQSGSSVGTFPLLVLGLVAHLPLGLFEHVLLHDYQWP